LIVAFTKRPPSGQMFAYDIRMAGVELLARRSIAEWDGDRDGAPERRRMGARLRACGAGLLFYGSKAKTMLPRLETETRALVEKRNDPKQMKAFAKLLSDVRAAPDGVTLVTVEQFRAQHAAKSEGACVRPDAGRRSRERPLRRARASSASCGDGYDPDMLGIERSLGTLIATVLLAIAANAQVARDPAHPIPADKRLPAAWIASLGERGVCRPCSVDGSRSGMWGCPSAASAAARFTLGATDVFGAGTSSTNATRAWSRTSSAKGLSRIRSAGIVRERDGANFVRPVEQRSPWNVDLGFSLRIEGATPRPLDRTGFRDISFEWRYPIGIVR
jgi:hypothetical protein